MADSSIDIASQALILLRADPISSFSDGSDASEAMSVLYDDFISYLFSLHPWNFSLKKQLLSQEVDAPVNEYKYAHILPAEAIFVSAVFDSDAAGINPITDYDIIGSGTARQIVSNYPTLYAEYTRKVSESVWTAEFTQFAIHALAAHAAIPITHDDEMAKYYNKEAYGSTQGFSNKKGGLFGVAASLNSKQKRNEMIASNPFVAARFS